MATTCSHTIYYIADIPTPPLNISLKKTLQVDPLDTQAKRDQRARVFQEYTDRPLAEQYVAFRSITRDLI